MGTAGESFEWKPGRTIPEDELTFRMDTSGGPGGQHANRSSTRVTLLWTPPESAAFSEGEKSRLRTSLGSRLSQEGVLQIRSSTHRSVTRNREECLQILARLVGEALRPRKSRVPTKPTRAAKERRLETKQRRSRTKEARRKPRPDE